jgi:hypothetical protein
MKVSKIGIPLNHLWKLDFLLETIHFGDLPFMDTTILLSLMLLASHPSAKAPTDSTSRQAAGAPVFTRNCPIGSCTVQALQDDVDGN